MVNVPFDFAQSTLTNTTKQQVLPGYARSTKTLNYQNYETPIMSLLAPKEIAYHQPDNQIISLRLCVLAVKKTKP